MRHLAHHSINSFYQYFIWGLSV
uniref:Uncharacterized protein n=1 Tax=Arundo donax TaxID=35708 RepID=A0A0A9I025_ARUDO